MKSMRKLVGERFGRLIVLEISHRKQYKNSTAIYYKCLCDCGKEHIVSSCLLRNGQVRSCGCLHDESTSQRFYKDVSGQKFGMLTVIDRAEDKFDNRGKPITVLNCICECGNIKQVVKNSLINGKTKSCGCNWFKSGIENARYNPNKTDKERENHRSPLGVDYKDFRQQIFRRDKFTCQCCSKVGGKLRAHHLDGWHWYMEGRYEETNLVTLCYDCHEEFHNIYKRRNNTKEQYQEFKDLKNGKVIK